MVLSLTHNKAQPLILMPKQVCSLPISPFTSPLPLASPTQAFAIHTALICLTLILLNYYELLKAVEKL